MNYPYYAPYQFGTQTPGFGRPAETGPGYAQPQNVAPVQPVGQGQGISPMSRPVSSKEEAMAVGADFSGAPMIFPDMAHNAVYVKRWDYQSGSAIFTEFVPKNTPPTPSEDPVAAWTRQDDFKEFTEKLYERLEDIEADLDRLKRKGVKKNDADE